MAYSGDNKSGAWPWQHFEAFCDYAPSREGFIACPELKHCFPFHFPNIEGSFWFLTAPFVVVARSSPVTCILVFPELIL